MTPMVRPAVNTPAVRRQRAVGTVMRSNASSTKNPSARSLISANGLAGSTALRRAGRRATGVLRSGSTTSDIATYGGGAGDLGRDARPVRTASMRSTTCWLSSSSTS